MEPSVREKLLSYSSHTCGIVFEEISMLLLQIYQLASIGYHLYLKRNQGYSNCNQKIDVSISFETFHRIKFDKTVSRIQPRRVDAVISIFGYACVHITTRENKFNQK